MNNYNDDLKGLDEFINNKVYQKEAMQPGKLLFLYCKTIRDCLIQTYNEHLNIKYSIESAELISSIFFILYNYTLNIKLSIFMCERSILLFNEYINISKSYDTNKIFIHEVKQFIINKSIGTIILNDTDKSSILIKNSEFLILFKNFIFKIFIQKMEDDTELLYTPVSFLDSTINLLLDIYYKLYSLNYKSIIAESIQKILDAPFIDKPKLINLDKLYLELVIYSIKTLKNTCDYSKEICGKIIEQNIDNIFIYEDINEFLNIEGSIIKKQCYKILLDKLLNYKFNV
tara:strand:+ start:9907 stop:10767 length:861 start_codon:yes stop_codon:yes gene_type:complete